MVRVSTAFTSTSDTERLVGLSDAVFAIAVTFLALDLSNLDLARMRQVGVAQYLVGESGTYLVYGLSVIVIGYIWWRHQSLFAKIERYGDRLRFANMFVLGFVTLMPYFTQLLGSANCRTA